jgi:hypothetical protein
MASPESTTHASDRQRQNRRRTGTSLGHSWEYSRRWSALRHVPGADSVPLVHRTLHRSGHHYRDGERWVRWSAGGPYVQPGWAAFEARGGEHVCVSSGEMISPALLGRE